MLIIRPSSNPFAPAAHRKTSHAPPRQVYYYYYDALRSSSSPVCSQRLPRPRTWLKAQCSAGAPSKLGRFCVPWVRHTSPSPTLQLSFMLIGAPSPGWEMAAWAANSVEVGATFEKEAQVHRCRCRPSSLPRSSLSEARCATHFLFSFSFSKTTAPPPC